MRHHNLLAFATATATHTAPAPAPATTAAAATTTTTTAATPPPPAAAAAVTTTAAENKMRPPQYANRTWTHTLVLWRRLRHSECFEGLQCNLSFCYHTFSSSFFPG